MIGFLYIYIAWVGLSFVAISSDSVRGDFTWFGGLVGLGAFFLIFSSMI